MSWRLSDYFNDQIRHHTLEQQRAAGCKIVQRFEQIKYDWRDGVREMKEYLDPAQSWSSKSLRWGPS